MIDGAAQSAMALARRCLPPDRGEWGHAMQAEFDLARQDGHSFGFAIGCLWTGCRALPFHARGRFVLVSHALALALLVPIATFHLGSGISAGRLLVRGYDPYYAMLAAKGTAGQAEAAAYLASAPVLMVLLFLLGAVHLLIAWCALEGHWCRVSILWAIGVSIAAGIVRTMGFVAPGMPGGAIQFAALAIELVALPPLAAWRHACSRLSFSMEV